MRTKEGKDIIKNGNGIWELFYSNGQKKISVQYRNGKKDSICLFWTESGLLDCQKKYDKGILINSEFYEYEKINGQHLVSRIRYNNRFGELIKIEYYKNQELVKTEKY